MDIKTVFFNNQPWFTSDIVLEGLNLVPDQHVNEDQLYQVIKGNLTLCEKELELSKKQ